MVKLQELQGVGVEDVEATASVHQHLGEPGVADDRIDDEWILPGVWDIIRVVIPIEGDRLPRPVEVLGNGHLNREDLSVFLLSLSHCEAR